ncbi:hypothetical protein OG372_00205 [Streptomyces sp. NBC_01020]|uniref:hypothetical protein n=1 Tax=Streptomyces sp. NBC_01020 TaxID=2903722 RepID=UPI00386663EE|nr:hypothetical protein OG372_00205 [Streptomyces sp. NBC_01020]
MDGHSAASPRRAWLLALSPALLAIPGASSVAHIEENVAAAGWCSTRDTLAELDGAGS